MLKATAQVLRVGLVTLRFKPIADFKVADDERIIAFGNVQRVANVVTMSMGDNDEICSGFFSADGCHRVSREERIH